MHYVNLQLANEIPQNRALVSYEKMQLPFAFRLKSMRRVKYRRFALHTYIANRATFNSRQYGAN